MSEVKSEMDSDIEQTYSISSNSVPDPKNMAELSLYVRTQKLEQIILWKKIKLFLFSISQVQTLLQGVQDKFQTMSDQIISRIDDMGSRIDELEKSIGDLMNQAGVENPEMHK